MKLIIIVLMCTTAASALISQFPLTYQVRKCCEENQYYNTLSHECQSTLDNEIFLGSVMALLTEERPSSYDISSEKISTCPETDQKPFTDMIFSNSSHVLFQDGSVLDRTFQHTYDVGHYCLEMVGEDLDGSALVLAYCPGKRDIIPKCCPADRYFDQNINECTPYYFDNETIGDRTLVPYLRDSHILKFQGELLCTDIPIKIDLEETSFKGNNLCLYHLEECYRMDKFCIENMLEEGGQAMVPAAYVCPDFFINKCCPEELSLHRSGCVKSTRQSLSLIHILKNYRYQIKGASDPVSKCSPFTIEDETRSDIQWHIDSYGLAVIRNRNRTIYTKNFCVDDFVLEDDVFPVIKVCSEDIDEYHEVSDIENWNESIGKCCPTNSIFHPNLTTTENSTSCLHISKFNGNTDKIEPLHQLNVTHLVFSNFPPCADTDTYHQYFLRESAGDYALIASDRSLVVVEQEGRCKMTETLIDPSRFCVDYVAVGDELRAAAIICAPSAHNSHAERNPIVVGLILVSCGALLMTFFTLILMRVRRGMITVKKVNTLAGRILISYVASQLIGYSVLCVGTLVDFQQDTQKCFILAGFLLFFLTAAFCWNTSICLEGLLLTLHVRVPEGRRFFYHCLWGWGVPAVITALALFKDAHGEPLECDALTPKFGKQRCFFSDPLAQLIYFYLPISITVTVNGVLLVTAKILRRSQLRKLAKDPNRIRRHGTLKQVFSIKGIRGKEQHNETLPDKSHSGLRTHQHKNIWIESMKLVLWSGITWILEVAGSLISVYIGRSGGEWYQYLWYLPVAFNCLRGLGIFVIIVLTTDNKANMLKTARGLRSNVGSNVTKMLRRDVGKATGRLQRTTLRQIRSSEERKQSVSTIMTSVSSSPSNSTDSTAPPSRFFHSVSQSDWSFPDAVLPDVFEGQEFRECGQARTSVDKAKETSKRPLDWARSIDQMEYCTHL